jgi:hypothetical protein
LTAVEKCRVCRNISPKCLVQVSRWFASRIALDGLRRGPEKTYATSS